MADLIFAALLRHLHVLHNHSKRCGLDYVGAVWVGGDSPYKSIELPRNQCYAEQRHSDLGFDLSVPYRHH